MFAYSILNLFTWLAFLSPQSELAFDAVQTSAFEVVITTGHNQSPAVIELGSHLNEFIDSSPNSKLSFANPFKAIGRVNAKNLEPKLLYFQIGNAIELELTSTTIIFPFHCFT